MWLGKVRYGKARQGTARLGLARRGEVCRCRGSNPGTGFPPMTRATGEGDVVGHGMVRLGKVRRGMAGQGTVR